VAGQTLIGWALFAGFLSGWLRCAASSTGWVGFAGFLSGWLRCAASSTG